MEKRQYGMDDKLVIKSDKENMQDVLACVIIMAAAMFVFLWESDIFAALFFTILIGRMTLYTWIGINRVLVMEKRGCTVSFYHYRKFYTWEDLAIKRWEKYCKIQIFFGDPSDNNYNEGVFFSKYPVKKSKRKTPMNYIKMRRPWTCFCVNFYPYGITEGHGDYRTNPKRSLNFFEMTGRWPEVYPVDKEVFVNYMKLWEVDIEGLSMDTENIRYV